MIIMTLLMKMQKELPTVADWNNPSDFVLNDARFNQIDYV
ncbi:hypothetical protein JZO67_004654 [Enterococcus sp. 665A]|uniref:Uncharacterized protein n=1 Tax=Candidatus Enterococcus ferrettii TaxID=2815324 RepID=A0ABV0EZI4_9ENTE